MTNPEDERIDRLLEEVLTGEKSADDAEVRALLEDTPELADRLATMQRMAQELDGVGDDEHDELARVLAERAPLDQQVASWAQQRRASTSTAPLPWRRWVAAAAVLLVSAFGIYELTIDDANSEPPPEVYLNLKDGEMKPDADGASGKVFAWNFDLPPGGYYVLQIYDASDRVNPLRTKNMGEEMEWRPTESEYRELPEHLYWEVIVNRGGSIPAGGGARTLRLRR